jgi:CRP-like cAMP-binding protein
MIAIMSDAFTSALLGFVGREQRLVGDNCLFRAGDPVLSLFFVSAGQIRLVRALPHGAQLTLQRAGIGAIVAEASVFAKTYHCDAIADDDSVLQVVPMERLRAALSGDGNLASALAERLARDVQRTRAQVEMLSLKTVAERVDAWIALNGGFLPPKGCWRQVASEIGVTSEALYREFARRR